jgi:hypothetical protein
MLNTLRTFQIVFLLGLVTAALGGEYLYPKNDTTYFNSPSVAWLVPVRIITSPVGRNRKAESGIVELTLPFVFRFFGCL